MAGAHTSSNGKKTMTNLHAPQRLPAGAQRACRARHDPIVIIAYAFLVVGVSLFFLGFAIYYAPALFVVSAIASASTWWRHRGHLGCEVAQLGAIGAGLSAFLLFLLVSVIATGRMFSP